MQNRIEHGGEKIFCYSQIRFDLSILLIQQFCIANGFSVVFLFCFVLPLLCCTEKPWRSARGSSPYNLSEKWSGTLTSVPAEEQSKDNQHRLLDLLSSLQNRSNHQFCLTGLFPLFWFHIVFCLLFMSSLTAHTQPAELDRKLGHSSLEASPSLLTLKARVFASWSLKALLGQLTVTVPAVCCMNSQTGHKDLLKLAICDLEF